MNSATIPDSEDGQLCECCGQLVRRITSHQKPECSAHLDKCCERLSGKSNVHYLLGNGYNFAGIPDASVTAIYCYDAMVHFASDIVKSYIDNAGRILALGGHILSHHPNYSTNPDSPSYGLSPHVRNHMSFELIQSLASGAGLEVIESVGISWGGITDLDRITLLRNPYRQTH